MDGLIAAYGNQIPKEAKIFAADSSPGMIEQIRKRKDQNHAWAKVEPAIHDATNLSEIPDGSLSHVVSGFTIFILPDPRKGMTEILRVLQTGGIFAFSSMAFSSWGELILKIKEIRPDKDIPQPGPPWTTEDGVRGELDATGFIDIETYSAPVYMPFEDPVEIVDYLMSTLPFMSMVTKVCDSQSNLQSQARFMSSTGS